MSRRDRRRGGTQQPQDFAGLRRAGGAELRHRIADGTSTTAAFGERPLGTNRVETLTPPAAPQLVMQELPGGADTTQSDCTAAGGTWNSQRGAKWILGNYGNTLYNHSLLPNAAAWDCTDNQQQKALAAAPSFHPGGELVLFCDGGVRFTTNDVATQTWHALNTPAGRDLP